MTIPRDKSEIIKDCWCRGFGFSQTQDIILEELGYLISFENIKSEYRGFDVEMEEFFNTAGI